MRNIFTRKKESNTYKYIAIFLLIFLSLILVKRVFSQNKESDKLDNSQKTEDQYENLLVKSLSRLEYDDNFKYNSKKSVLFVSDTKGKKVFVITLNGKILYEIGSGKKGFLDGNFDNAKFCSPVGLTYKDNNLYVADSCNNAVRKIDFKNQTVSTLVKDDEVLINPIDVKFFPNKKKIAISCFNKYGLSSYNIKKDELKTVVDESLENRNISKIYKYDNKLYFLDKSKNTIFTLDKKDNIEEFLKMNVAKIKAESFHIDDTGIYVLDKNNSKLFKADIENKEWKLYSGGNLAGNKLGKISETELNLPSDILAVKDRLYIADTNNHRIVEVDKNKDKIFAISIYPDIFSKGLSELNGYLNNSTFKDKIKFSYEKEGKILLNVGDDLKFTKNAPNTLYIFEQNEKEAILIKTYSANEIELKNLTIPELKKNKKYYIQGTFYYCKKADISPCLIKNYNKKLIASEKDVENYLTIEF